MSSGTPPRADPMDALGYLLKHAAMQLTEMTDAALAAFDIDSKDYGALRLLVRTDGMSQVRLAQTLGVDRTSMVALIDALEAKGIVTRRPDPEDRRRNVVELTEAGTTAFDRAAEAYEIAEREFLDPVSARAGSQLTTTLQGLVAAGRARADQTVVTRQPPVD